MIYLTADTHLGHSKIINYCNRPFSSILEMDYTILNNINNLVKKNDILIILGDFSFYPERYYYLINCENIILIKGNHDPKKAKRVFKYIFSDFNLMIGDHNCLLTHRPTNISKYDFNICGHVHNNWFNRNKSINIGVDVMGFEPISYINLAKVLKEYDFLKFGE